MTEEEKNHVIAAVSDVMPNTVATTAQMANLWNCTPADLREWCRKGYVLNARKVKGRWQIPVDSLRPIDKKLAIELLYKCEECRNEISSNIDLSIWGITSAQIGLYLSTLCKGHYIIGKAIDVPSGNNGKPALPWLTKKGLDFLVGRGAKQADAFNPLVCASECLGVFSGSFAASFLECV